MSVYEYAVFHVGDNRTVPITAASSDHPRAVQYVAECWERWTAAQPGSYELLRRDITPGPWEEASTDDLREDSQ